MTKNFEYLAKYKDNKLEQLISKYKNNLLNNEIHFNFGNHGRKILEYFVSTYVSKGIKTNIKFISLFKEKYGDLPELVYMSLNVLKGFGNYSSHYDDDNINYEIDLSTKIQILKCLRLVFDFVLDYKSSNDKFNEEIYWREKQDSLNILIKQNNDINNNPSKQSFNVIKKSIGDLLLSEDIFFYIPSYQRNYRWTRETCEDLFLDLIKTKEENEVHYFGVMATTNDLLDNDKLQIKLIDGQQRITTSFLFLRSIYDRLIQRNSDSTVPKRLNKIFNFNEYPESLDLIKNKIINVTGNKNSDEALQKILTGDNTMQDSYDNMSTQVFKNYRKFKLLLEEKTFEEIEVIYTHFVNSFQVSIIIYNIDEPSQEMNLFENLNSKGTKLTAFDLAKNYLLNLVNKNDFKKYEKNIIDKFNKEIIIELESFKNKEEDAKSTKREDFLFYYTNFISLKKNSKKSLLKDFQDCIKNEINYHNSISISEFNNKIEEIGKFSYIFETIENKTYFHKGSEFYAFKDELNNISFKDFHYPFLFYIFNLYGNYNNEQRKFLFENIEKIKLSLFVIEIWVIRLLQVSGTGQSLQEPVLFAIKYLKEYEQTSNFLNNLPYKLFKYLRGIEKNNNPIVIRYFLPETYEMPSQIKFEKALNEEIKQLQTIGIALLTRLEKTIHNWNKYNERNWIYLSKASIEHIMPNKIDDNWIKDIVRSSKETLNEEIIRNKHSYYKNKIGNLLLIEKKHNASLGNQIFAVKKVKYDQAKTPLMETIKFGINDLNIITIKYWNFESIDERTSSIAKILANDIYKDLKDA